MLLHLCEICIVFRVVHVTWVDDLPAQKACVVDSQRNGVEHLDVLWVAVEHCVWEDGVVTNSVFMVVVRLIPLVHVFRTSNKAHVVIAHEVERCLTACLHELWW